MKDTLQDVGTNPNKSIKKIPTKTTQSNNSFRKKKKLLETILHLKKIQKHLLEKEITTNQKHLKKKN